MSSVVNTRRQVNYHPYIIVLLELLLVLFFFQSIGCNSIESCECEEDFNFIVNYIEENYPGFKKDVKNHKKEDYQLFKSRLAALSSKIYTYSDCLKLCTRYVEYFDDNHTHIRALKKQKDSFHIVFKSSFIVEDYLHFEYPEESIEGLYVSTDLKYEVVVIRHPSHFTEYIGIVAKSNSPLWRPNQVKFELKKKSDNVYEGFFYDDFHNIHYETSLLFNGGFLGNKWVKENLKDKTNYSLNSSQAFSFNVVDSTVVLRIPSFSGSNTLRVDSLINVAHKAIQDNPMLLIDIRNNGGGNSSNFNRLIPYLYTEKIIVSDVVEYYATPQIIELYEKDFSEIAKDSLAYPPRTIKLYKDILNCLYGVEPGSFGMIKTQDTIDMVPLALPRTIGILFNKGCASACEDFVLMAKNSGKTILIGENSGGFLGYGNIFTSITPSGNFGLTCSTSRYSNQYKYEVIGVEPDYFLDYESDWVTQSIEILVKSYNLK